ncbi:MAG TPA: enoyl-CoA hydratase-related protein [Vicinamibacterales bacterium]|jgi:methylglutaconyl-CoA hydratase|nr:enoyl-CoA hydratase-related protein [Vicinamibacterales bacterium]
MSFQCLHVQRDGAVEYLTLHRPEVRNAFNEQVIDELTRWGTAIAEDPHVRCVVLAGAGQTFCAGADLSWMSKMVAYTHEENVRDAQAMARMFSVLDTLPVPVIGRIHGAALGGGAGLVAVCDVVVADEDTLFGFTEVKLGILPAVIAPYAIAKIGQSAARELFLTGMRFSAAHAKEIGLVHRVIPSTRLVPTVKEYVTEVLSAGPEGIAAAKALIPKVWNKPAQDTMTLTAEAIAARRVSTEGQEGMKAFMKKAKASWNLS